VLRVDNASHVLMSDKLTLEVWAPDNPEASLERRIDAIIYNMEQIREVQRRNSEQIDEMQDSHIKNQKKQEQELKNMKDQVMSDLESLHTDDIVQSLIGLVWLAFGISISTISQELSKIVIF